MKTTISCALLISLTSFSCVSLNDSADKPPLITEKSSTEEALHAGIIHGGDVLLKAKELLHQRNEWFKAADLLKSHIHDNFQTIPDNEFINAINIYIACADPKSPDFFVVLNKSNRKIAHRLSWVVAGTLSSPAMTQAIETRLSDLIASDLIDLHLMPDMASALKASGLKSVYTILREGLLNQGSPEFASAMASLNPSQASDDFMIYLSQVTFEELRQISVPKINVMAATEIFEHFYYFPPSIAHPDFNLLFLYAVSRNRLLAEMANKILASYLPAQAYTLAVMLSSLDEPVQMAFIEHNRRNMNSELRLFMEELRNVSAKNDIIEEINALY